MQQEPILIRLPNWVGDVCMSLPVLDMLRRLNIPFAVCARGWAKDLLAGLGTAGFVPMSGRLIEDVVEVRDWRKRLVARLFSRDCLARAALGTRPPPLIPDTARSHCLRPPQIGL